MATRTLSKSFFHLAQGQDDFNGIVYLWKERFKEMSNYGGDFILQKMNTLSAIILRNQKTDQIISCLMLDFSTFPKSIFIPLLLTDKKFNKKENIEKTIRLIFSLCESTMINQILIYFESTSKNKKMFNSINEEYNKNNVPIRSDIVGEFGNLFGDGRNVLLTSTTFIDESERPNLMRRLSSRINTGAGALAGHLVLNATCCSGCGEKSKEVKDGKEGKDNSKDGKDKEGKELERQLNPSEPQHGNDIFDTSFLLSVYDKVGIKKYDRYNSKEKYISLIEK